MATKDLAGRGEGTKEVTGWVGSTKELALRLGAVRTRSLQGGQAARASMQRLSHLLVLDFESTCWEGRGGPPPEIIEFPVILLCLRTVSLLTPAT